MLFVGALLLFLGTGLAGLEFGEHHMEVLWDRVKRCFPDIANQILSTRQPQYRRGETVILEEGGEKYRS